MFTTLRNAIVLVVPVLLMTVTAAATEFNPVKTPVPDNPYMAHAPGEGGLEIYYACTRGSVASACARLNGESSALAEDTPGLLPDYYACTRGNYAPACTSLDGNKKASTPGTPGLLPDYYACTRGSDVPACDRLYNRDTVK